ncbi:hypothetical protein CDEST_14807 [Colletotrichum destructivum]|uniref:Uncharacterized protein n=1 Tax=Colletotrichum destructivum TaxID=34406 RepID=A0AAX4J339_9PEZI|nr:hypothetical protein CDEST_14807 [Colletotrichum destructivum]
MLIHIRHNTHPYTHTHTHVQHPHAPRSCLCNGKRRPYPAPPVEKPGRPRWLPRGGEWRETERRNSGLLHRCRNGHQTPRTYGPRTPPSALSRRPRFHPVLSGFSSRYLQLLAPPGSGWTWKREARGAAPASLPALGTRDDERRYIDKANWEMPESRSQQLHLVLLPPFDPTGLCLAVGQPASQPAY